MKKSPLFLLSVFLMTVLIGCSSSEKNPGFSIYSTPEDFKVDVTRLCGSKYDEWVALSNIPIRPTLGTSKIKQILSAIHNIGLALFEGCSDIGLDKNFEKAFIYLQLANDFEYIPTRYVLGKALVKGEIIQKDLNLGTSYLEQVIYCDRSFGFKYRNQAEAVLKDLGHPFEVDVTEFDKNCNQILGAYFKGPTVEFDALAFKTDWEGRSTHISENWGWLGAGFRGTATFIEEALPVALAGAAFYYSAKKSQEYRSIPQYSVPRSVRSSRTNDDSSFSFDYKTPSNVTGNTGNQVFTSKLGCISDFQCGLGRVCVKPYNAISLTGLCGTLVDDYGVPTYTVPTPSAGPHEISACSFDLNCPIGFKCRKMGYELFGVCVRQ